MSYGASLGYGGSDTAQFFTIFYGPAQRHYKKVGDHVSKLDSICLDNSITSLFECQQLEVFLLMNPITLGKVEVCGDVHAPFVLLLT